MTKKKKSRQGHRLHATKLMTKAEEIVKNYYPSLENKLKQLKMSLQNRLETIHSLDADILDTPEDKKAIEEEIKEAGIFSEKVLEIVVEIESVLSRKTQDNHEHGAPPPSQASQGPALQTSTRNWLNLP